MSLNKGRGQTPRTSFETHRLSLGDQVLRLNPQLPHLVLRDRHQFPATSTIAHFPHCSPKIVTNTQMLAPQRHVSIDPLVPRVAVERSANFHVRCQVISNKRAKEQHRVASHTSHELRSAPSSPPRPARREQKRHKHRIITARSPCRLIQYTPWRPPCLFPSLSFSSVVPAAASAMPRSLTARQFPTASSPRFCDQRCVALTMILPSTTRCLSILTSSRSTGEYPGS